MPFQLRCDCDWPSLFLFFFLKKKKEKREGFAGVIVLRLDNCQHSLLVASASREPEARKRLTHPRSFVTSNDKLRKTPKPPEIESNQAFKPYRIQFTSRLGSWQPRKRGLFVSFRFGNDKHPPPPTAESYFENSSLLSPEFVRRSSCCGHQSEVLCVCECFFKHNAANNLTVVRPSQNVTNEDAWRRPSHEAARVESFSQLKRTYTTHRSCARPWAA